MTGPDVEGGGPVAVARTGNPVLVFDAAGIYRASQSVGLSPFSRSMATAAE
ncbi:hypothetical protein [Martelella alba]|uniref:hypothetical protein n=1 Tax=Martelella alba TaxID=2590451 RepID=UPI0015E870CC|nr:hypothetical protein [Martelella alba]